MDNIKKYNLFILISTLARNVVEVFSSVFLYKMGYGIREILVFFCILYFIGSIVCAITIYLLGKINIKYLLILSSIIFSISFYYMSNMDKNIINLIIFGIIYSMGLYSYHSIRHYIAIKIINNIGNIIIYTNLAIIISSLLSGYIESVTNTIFLSIIVIIISIFSIIPILKLDIKKENSKIIYSRLDMNKKLFFILEQSKVIFLSLEPLFIYLFVEESIKYVGVISSLIGLASCVFIYFFVRRVDDKKHFKYFNMLFCIVLLLKLNISSKYIILIIAFMEGLLIKMYDVVSIENLYEVDRKVNIRGYLIKSEIIFCLVRSIFCFIFIFISDIRIMLYILLAFIFMSGFIKK